MNRKMKDSGVPWIGEIPKAWDVKPLKAILAERKETNNPVKTDYILSLTIDRGVIPYSEKGNGGNKSKEDLTQYKLAYPNDIVLNSMNVIVGSVGLSKYFGAVSPVYYMLYPRNMTDRVKYYNNIFQTKVFQGSLIGYGNGIMMKQSEVSQKLNTIRMRIPMSKLNTVMLPCPPSKEQQKIVDFLDGKVTKIDNIINKTTISIEEYKKYKQSIITETLKKGLNPDVEMKDSGVEYIGVIPKYWNIKRLRYLGTLQNGISTSSEYFGFGYPFVSYGDIHNNIELPLNGSGLINSNDTERKNYSVEQGDVLFTRTSETVEEIGFSSTCLKTIENAVFTGFVIRFRPSTNELNEKYSKYYFRSEMHRRFFVKEINLVTRASLSQELLKKLPVIIPSKKEQQQIADYLDEKCFDIDNLIKQKELLLTELEAYKKSLIYEYVTGKKEVK